MNLFYDIAMCICVNVYDDYRMGLLKSKVIKVVDSGLIKKYECTAKYYKCNYYYFFSFHHFFTSMLLE